MAREKAGAGSAVLAAFRDFARKTALNRVVQK
jgi:hypothetical protein